MIATTEIPVDPALPSLAVIRESGLNGAVPALRVEEGRVEFVLRGYSPGLRATIEARVGKRRLAIKAYAEDPSPEAELYEALAAAGFDGSGGVWVPRLLEFNREWRLLVIGWLEGKTAQQLIKDGQGERAGRLAASWFQRVMSLPVAIGPPFGAPRMLSRGRKWAAALGLAEPALGNASTTLIETLTRTQPQHGETRLVHGTFYARHLLDLGDGPGVIDWQRFAQGPLELDAGMFLATIWRLGLGQEYLATEAARAEAVFHSETLSVLDEHALAWHRAAALLRLANNSCKPLRRRGDWTAKARVMLDEALRLAATV